MGFIITFHTYVPLNFVLICSLPHMLMTLNNSLQYAAFFDTALNILYYALCKERKENTGSSHFSQAELKCTSETKGTQSFRLLIVFCLSVDFPG